MADLQKFLDRSGVSTLWTQVANKITTDVAAEKTRAEAKEAELLGKINENATAIANEATTARAAEAANAKAISDLEGSVATQIADAVAALVNGAPEAYNTLKEISDWIAGHPEQVSALNTSIKANADAIDALEALVGNKAVATQITDALASYVTATSLNNTLGAYVKSADVADVHAQVTTNKNSIANLTNRIDGIVAGGGEPNTINTIKVNGVAQAIAEDKSVNIVVPVIEALTAEEIQAACK